MFKWVIGIILILASYFLGNISPSTIIARSMGHDIKNEGSGNAGTTNALRVLGGKAAILTLFIDVGKGLIAVLIGYNIMKLASSYEGFSILISSWCGLSAFMGHVFPITLDFKGGKGVATGLGVLIAYDYKLAILSLIVFILVVAITKYVSIGSIFAAISYLIFYILRFYLFAGEDGLGDSFGPGLMVLLKYLLPFIIMVIILIFKHGENIERVRHREEKKIHIAPGGKIEFIDPEEKA